MEKRTTKVDSFAERRNIFKTIWDTTMQMDEEDNIPMSPVKNKVIKTLRLEPDTEKNGPARKKKHRIKALRVVCNKILDFCDKQEAEDILYDKRTKQNYNAIKSYGMPKNTKYTKKKKLTPDDGKTKMKVISEPITFSKAHSSNKNKIVALAYDTVNTRPLKALGNSNAKPKGKPKPLIDISLNKHSSSKKEKSKVKKKKTTSKTKSSKHIK